MDFKLQASFGKYFAYQPKKKIRLNQRATKRHNVELLTPEEASERNRGEYLSFIANWKRAYAATSNQIRSLKNASKDMKIKESERQMAMRYLAIARAQARSMMICRESIEIQYEADKFFDSMDVEHFDTNFNSVKVGLEEIVQRAEFQEQLANDLTEETERLQLYA